MSEKILVAGAGRSGIAASKMILELGGEVLLFDENPELDVAEIKKNFPDTDKITFITGELKRKDINGISICVISPGINPDKASFVEMLDKAGVQIWSEIQLAFQKDRGTLVAITGTNGKTTTTALTGAIMQKKYPETFVAGNIGIPYTSTCLKTSEDSVTVLETSSFQLETIIDFKPHVSAILNLTPDHLDRHHTFDNYVLIKECITMNQDENDYCILNYDDPLLRKFGESDELKAKAIYFSSSEKLQDGYGINDGYICRYTSGKEYRIVALDELILIGTHNYENVLAAVAMAECMQVPENLIREACMEFKPVEHRLEFVRSRAGVNYYNDSKGTNPDAAIRALCSMKGKTILIGGGYDKNSSYDEWVEKFEGRVKYLVLIGETRDAIAECCRQHGFSNIMYAESMQEAVAVCASYADIGDNVLLSPACASWDMFKNYEERGKIFKECVNNL